MSSFSFSSGRLVAPWWRSLVGSGLCAGACRWQLRASHRSFSGAVVVVSFSSSSAASRFASAWAPRVGFALAVRCFSSAVDGVVWSVSVPVAVPPSLPLAGAPAFLPAPVLWVSR